MKIEITKEKKIKIFKKVSRDIEIELSLTGRTRTIVYKNKKKYNRKKTKLLKNLFI